MDALPEEHRKAFSKLAQHAEHARGTVEPSMAMRDAISGITGRPSMRLMQDMLAKDALLSAFSPANAAMERIQSMRLTEDRTRWMLDLTTMPLMSVFDRLNAQHTWLDKAIGIASQKWMKGTADLGGVNHMQTVLDETHARLARSSARFDQPAARLRAISDALKPTPFARSSMASLFERFGLDSAVRMKELFEPAYTRTISDTLTRIQTEQAAFTKALPNLSSRWADIDWMRMQRLMDHAATLTDEGVDTEDGDDAWDIESIPPEDQAQVAEAIRPVASAVERAAASPQERNKSQAQAIAHIIELQETLIARYELQEERVGKLEKPPLPLWVRALIKILEWVVIGLLLEWAGSHVSPAIDRVLGLLSEPVSTHSRPSAIRRDAADAMQAIEESGEDARMIRVVVRRSLPVYGRPESRDSLIHRLRSGQILAIVEWRKKWRLVSWRDADSGELHSGWVRAKYIAKILR